MPSSRCGPCVPNPDSGTRKQLIDCDADGVDGTSDEEVQRACTAFGAVLRYCRPTEPDEQWDERLAKIAAEFSRDGFEITRGPARAMRNRETERGWW
ncbi:hypothetical protein ACFWP3_37920 [Streptomyces sp. NPDC058525]|uniref:hypothetical protein n=1 Tax=Streptomyces sp. NPDC058525 TaxID=3346538 RepID=UPI00364EBA71